MAPTREDVVAKCYCSTHTRACLQDSLRPVAIRDLLGVSSIAAWSARFAMFVARRVSRW
jgi:hypothetical protein